MGWIVIVIAVIAVVFFGYRHIEPGRVSELAQQTVEAAKETARTAADVAGEAGRQAMTAAAGLGDRLAGLTIDGVDLGARISGAVSSVTATLAGVTDSTNADAAKARLDEAASTLDGLGDRVAQLPEAGRETLATALRSVLPTLRAGADKAAATAPDLKPTLDAIIAKLTDWSQPKA